MIIKMDKDYEVKCTLGTIKDIESYYNKPFFTIVSAMDKLTTTDQIKLLYIGVKRADNLIKENDFNLACENNLGLAELIDYLDQFLLQLQYPGLSRGDIENKIEKKLQAAEKLRALTGTK